MADMWDAFPDAPKANASANDIWAAFPDVDATGVQSSQTARTAPVSAWDVRDETGVPGGAREPTAPMPTTGQRAIDISSGVLGAPVDTMNDILSAVGLPVSDAPLFGSRSIGSMMNAASGETEGRDIAERRPDLAQSSAPLGQRVYSSFLNTPDAKARYLTSQYGPENQGWYYLNDRFGNPTDRVVIRDGSGKESIFNPPGIDAGDIAGMAGGVPDLIGALAGGAASIPAYAAGPVVGVPATALASSVGAQAVGETVGRLFPENREAEPSITNDVLPRASYEALIDTIMGTAMGGASSAVGAVTNKVRAPFAKSASEPMAVEFRAAADRLKERGYDINPLPSESGAGGFVPRMEGMLEKLPGSSEKLRQTRQAGDDAIARYQSDLTQGTDPVKVGREVTSELATQRKNLIIDRESALARADDSIAANETALLDRQGPLVGAEDAGQQMRSGLDSARQNFREEANRLYEQARNAPGGRDAIVNMQPVRDQASAIRDALPPEARRSVSVPTGLLDASGAPISRATTIGGGPSGEFTPQGLSRFLSGVDDIADTMTLDQARQMRALVSDAMNDKTILPGVPERYLGQLRQSLTEAIDGSVNNVSDPQLRHALSDANRFYRENVDQFSRKGVAEAYREPTQPGYVEDNQLVSRLLAGGGKPGVIRDMKRTLGEQSPEWAAARRSAIEQIFDSGRSPTLYGRKVVNVDGLVAKLNQMDDGAISELFGVKDAKQLRNLAADISNRSKYLDAEALSQNGTPNILSQLRAAAKADNQISIDYRKNVISPFLRGEDGSAAKLSSAELVPWLYRRASPEEANAVISKLPSSMRADVERGVVADIVENAISKGNGDISAVRRLITGDASPADSQDIARVLGVGKDAASRQQADRINVLLSPESRQALRDLALITAKRQERDATTSAIGGLAAGAAVTGIMSSPSAALKASIISRGLAEMVTSEPVRKWLTNTKQTKLSPVGKARLVSVTPALADVVTGALGENEHLQAAMDWLREGESQINRAGDRIQHIPDDFGTWEQYFGTDRM